MLRAGLLSGLVGLVVGLILLAYFREERPISLASARGEVYQVNKIAFDDDDFRDAQTWRDLVIFQFISNGFDQAEKTVKAIRSPQGRAIAANTLAMAVREESEKLGLVPEAAPLEMYRTPDGSAVIPERIKPNPLSAKDRVTKTIEITDRLARTSLLVEDVPDGAARASILNGIASHYMALGRQDFANAVSSAALASLNRAERSRRWISIVQNGWAAVLFISTAVGGLVGVGIREKWFLSGIKWLGYRLSFAKRRSRLILPEGVAN